jgi:hypothetical protein
MEWLGVISDNLVNSAFGFLRLGAPCCCVSFVLFRVLATALVPGGVRLGLFLLDYWVIAIGLLGCPTNKLSADQ